jgi:DNA-binding MarR family transcriptional regulator
VTTRHPDPSQDDPAGAIIGELRAFATALDRYIDAHGGRHGLHRTDLNALGHVMDAGRRGRALTPGELATALNLSAPATSALLARLEAVGHVRRSHSATDRRRVSIELTDEARGVGREVFSPIGAAVREVIARYDAQESEVVLRFLADVVEATNAAAADDGTSGGGRATRRRPPRSAPPAV